MLIDTFFGGLFQNNRVPCPTAVGNMFQVVDFLFHLAVNHEVVPEFDGVGVPWFCGKGRAVFHCTWSGIHI